MQAYPILSEYLIKTFNKKIVKLPIDGGFTCPNRINNKKGCLFCSDTGSGEFTYKGYSISDQIELQKKRLENKKIYNRDISYIAYFQNFTNTYDSVENLRYKYTQALSCKDIVGLAIATRPDCINNEILELLKEINNLTHLWIELGLQSSNENTAELIERGYNNQVFELCVNNLHLNSIKTVAHIIFGLPNETKKDYYKTVYYVKSLGMWGIKIHSLYIQKSTRLYDYYFKNPFHILSRNEYTEAASESIKILDNQLIIHRLTGDCEKSLLFEPKWSLDKLKVISEINRKLSV